MSICLFTKSYYERATATDYVPMYVPMYVCIPLAPIVLIRNLAWTLLGTLGVSCGR